MFLTRFLASLLGIETKERRNGEVNYFSVFSVPIRDWNPGSEDGHTLADWFLASLLGIETQERHKKFAPCPLFLASLLGIETWPEQPNNPLEAGVISVPIRDWNL